MSVVLVDECESVVVAAGRPKIERQSVTGSEVDGIIRGCVSEFVEVGGEGNLISNDLPSGLGWTNCYRADHWAGQRIVLLGYCARDYGCCCCIGKPFRVVSSLKYFKML